MNPINDGIIPHPYADRVTHYRTKDGKLHEMWEDIDTHIVCSLENAIGPLIDEADSSLPFPLSHQVRLAIVDALVGTPAKAMNLKTLLDRYV